MVGGVETESPNCDMFSDLTTTAISTFQAQTKAVAVASVLGATVAFLYGKYGRKSRRNIPKNKERVVVIGGGR